LDYTTDVSNELNITLFAQSVFMNCSLREGHETYGRVISPENDTNDRGALQKWTNKNLVVVVRGTQRMIYYRPMPRLRELLNCNIAS
jgi:hypothetical protein